MRVREKERESDREGGEIQERESDRDIEGRKRDTKEGRKREKERKSER